MPQPIGINIFGFFHLMSSFSPKEHFDFILTMTIHFLFYIYTGTSSYMEFWAGDLLQADDASTVHNHLSSP